MNLLVTNHAQVLACIARNPLARLRDVAESVGLTERAVQRLVSDLEAEGFLRRIREGRRNRYEVAAAPLQLLARSLQALVPEGSHASMSCAHEPEAADVDDAAEAEADSTDVESDASAAGVESDARAAAVAAGDLAAADVPIAPLADPKSPAPLEPFAPLTPPSSGDGIARNQSFID